MRAVVLCDNRHHPAATVRAGPAPLAATAGLDFDWVEITAAWQPESMRAYPAAVLSKSNTITQNNPQPWLTPTAGVAAPFSIWENITSSPSADVFLHTRSSQPDGHAAKVQDAFACSRRPHSRRVFASLLSDPAPQCAEAGR